MLGIGQNRTILIFGKKKSNNIAAFLTVPRRTKKCLTIYSILNNDNINYIHFILWDSENAMSRQQPTYI